MMLRSDLLDQVRCAMSSSSGGFTPTAVGSMARANITTSTRRKSNNAVASSAKAEWPTF